MSNKNTYVNPNERPMTASKPIKSPKKRGRQGSNVINAFQAVPTTPTPVEAFSAQYNVSIHCLRQAKRFDQTGLNGAVRVKKDKETGMLMIWREAEASE